MDYDITIVSGEDDFYLADALCRELEKSGKRCLFNWRDEKNPLKPSPKIIRKSPVFCLLLCNDVLNNSNLKALAKMHSGMKEVEEVVLTTDKDVTIPTDWKNVRTIDATNGLTPGVINGILSGASEAVSATNISESRESVAQRKQEEDAISESREAKVRRKQAEAAKRAQDWEDFKRGFNGKGLLNDALNIFK